MRKLKDVKARYDYSGVGEILNRKDQFENEGTDVTWEGLEGKTGKGKVI